MPVNYRSLVTRPYIRILRILQEKGPLRFNEIAKETALDPKTVDRILKAFSSEHYVYSRALPPEGRRLPAKYRIGPRGTALLEVQLSAARAAEKHRRILGTDLVAEIQNVA